MVHLVLACMLATAQEPAVRPRAVQGKQIYQVKLRADRRDYPLTPPPGPGPCQVLIAGDGAAKSKLVFTGPLAAGSYELDLRSDLPGDRTLVFSVPLQGASTFVVTAAGGARYDFSFRMAGGKEYRFTFTAPVDRKTFRLAP
jgi:hypothetical protein